MGGGQPTAARGGWRAALVLGLCLLPMVLPAAKTKTYYAKLTATANQGGKVFVNTSKSDAGASYDETFSKSSSSSSASVQSYVYAKGNKGYKFNKWTAGAGSAGTFSGTETVKLLLNDPVTLEWVYSVGSAKDEKSTSGVWISNVKWASAKTPSGRVRPYVRATWKNGKTTYERVEE